MPSPFPGMDPYLEISGDWRDFHSRFLNSCALRRLRNAFPRTTSPASKSTSRFWSIPRTPSNIGTPMLRSREFNWHHGRRSGGGHSDLEPEVIPLVTTIIEDVKERWIEIRRRPDWAPVTIIELLSPTNKHGHGYDDYLYKRVSLIARSIHLVELDLLIGGRRPPMGRPLRGDYHALVSRTEERPLSNVYSWPIRQGLPTIPIPLLAPDSRRPARPGGGLHHGLPRASTSGRSTTVPPLDLPRSAAADAPGPRSWLGRSGRKRRNDAAWKQGWLATSTLIAVTTCGISSARLDHRAAATFFLSKTGVWPKIEVGDVQEFKSGSRGRWWAIRPPSRSRSLEV